MAAVNIIIKAVNSTKGAFNEVGRQAADLNKKLSAMSRIFKGLFVAGIAAKFGKSLLEASSYSLELEQSAGRIKKAWQPIGEEIGDAFARIVLSLERPINAVGGFFESVINNAQKAAAFLTGLAVTRSFAEAKRIAEETVAELEAEQKTRREARAEQEAANAAEIAAAKRMEDLEKRRRKLNEELGETRKKNLLSLADEQEKIWMLEEEIKRVMREVNDILADPDISDIEKEIAAVEAQIKFDNLDTEIERIRRGIKEAVQEADAIDKKRKPGSRLISFDRAVRGKLADRVQETLRGEGMGDMSRRSMERASKLNDVGPSLETAAHLKKIRDNFETLVQELTR